MTEAEAKTKACSYAAGFNASHEGRYFRSGASERGDLPTCIGSACISWRGNRPMGPGELHGYCARDGVPAS